jgi:N-acetylmuramoyl-L-alanine amidase
MIAALGMSALSPVGRSAALCARLAGVRRVLLLALAVVLGGAAPARAEVIGHSAQGRPITVTHRGDAAAPVSVLVVGSIHGNETAGHAVIARLRRVAVPAGVQLWLVRTVNPDGVARGTRQNARGVDLNRNFPFRWKAAGRPWDTNYSGRTPASEPETTAVRRLVTRVQPDITLYYHQHLRLVNLSQGADPALVRDYAGRVGLPARTLPYYRGTASSWQNDALPGTSAFVVELPAGPLGPAAARRHADAVVAIARGEAKAASMAPRPHIVWKRIPFGRDRQAEMRAYARRHYGLDTARLTDPKVIVEHMTATSAFGPAWNTFASNARDPELHELPGTCAHFIVDRDGTIYQLVSLHWMCRHTVGLNWTAFGIEHVGMTDSSLMGDQAQLNASLALTRWLMERYGISQPNVIGHNESLSSPYHRERVARLRRQTHGDMKPATMRRYRALLTAR